MENNGNKRKRDYGETNVKRQRIKIGELVEGRFRILSELGSGGSGIVYEAQDEVEQKLVALKAVADLSAATNIKNEYDITFRLSKKHKIQGIPKALYLYREQRPFFVMESLGIELSDLVPGEGFSLKTVCMIGINLLQILKQVHSVGIVHDDICARNIMIPREIGKGAALYIIDFGAARPITTAKADKEKGSGHNVPKRRKTNLSKSSRGRRMDVIRLLCTLGIVKGGQLQVEWNIMRFLNVHVTEMEYASLPTEVEKITSHILKILPMDEPDYDFLIEMFGKMLKAKGWKNDGMFDWVHNFL